MVKAYCLNCDDDVEFEIQEREIKTKIKGISFSYIAKIPFCKECHEEMYVAEFSDENVRSANERYRELSGLIHIDEIRDILQQYDIGHKPLSRLLGWGEATIYRYLSGLTPSKEYSEALKRLKLPENMLRIFELNKGVLTDVAQRKLSNKLNELMNQNQPNSQDTKLNFVARYYLSKIDPGAGESVTPLKLQKLVYYTQAWVLGLNHTILFEEDAQAWVHGPVYPSLYYIYRNFGYNNIPKVTDFDVKVFNENERYILDMVWLVYGKYDAKYLERLTHHEDPWRESRKGLSDSDKCNWPITKDLIEQYYSRLSKEYGIYDYHSLNRYVAGLDV